MYLAQRTALCNIARQGSCVIVGRGAGGVLKEEAPLLNVFVYAELALRRQRAIEEYGDSPYKIEERIHKIDKKRAAYFRFYTGTNGLQMENYHLCLDSGFLGLDAAVNVLEAAYRGNP